MIDIIYDTIILGAGPAGLTAGIYASRRQMKALIIGKMIGGQMAWAHSIENYPGFKSVSNYELISKMQEQVKALGVEIKTEEIVKIEKAKDYFVLSSEENQYQAKTVVLAMGLSPAKLNIPGEKEFLGKGISYCANCDGPLFKNKVVAVVGGGNAALDAAEVLTKIANQVYLIHRKDTFRGFETLVDKVMKNQSIEKILSSQITEIYGQEKLEKIKIKNLNEQTELELKINGLFIEIGHQPDTAFLNGLVKLNQGGYIVADSLGKTSQPGIFAAGDVIESEFKQIVIACGQGAIAALSAYKYLQLALN